MKHALSCVFRGVFLFKLIFFWSFQPCIEFTNTHFVNTISTNFFIYTFCFFLFLIVCFNYVLHFFEYVNLYTLKYVLTNLSIYIHSLISSSCIIKKILSYIWTAYSLCLLDRSEASGWRPIWERVYSSTSWIWLLTVCSVKSKHTQSGIH